MAILTTLYLVLKVKTANVNFFKLFILKYNFFATFSYKLNF